MLAHEDLKVGGEVRVVLHTADGIDTLAVPDRRAVGVRHHDDGRCHSLCGHGVVENQGEPQQVEHLRRIAGGTRQHLDGREPDRRPRRVKVGVR